MSITKDEVVYGFKYILGREPENEKVIEQHRLESVRALRAVLLKSAEFREKYLKEFPATSRNGSAQPATDRLEK